MKPEDDSRWPECLLHKEGDRPLQHWCDSTRAVLIAGKDADGIETGLRYSVPIVPVLDFYATVAIDAEDLGDCAMMYLVAGSDPFGSGDDLIPLGMWSKGEGRMILATSVLDWMEGRQPEQCDASTHGFKENNQYIAMTSEHIPDSIKANKWCLAYHGCCYPCWINHHARRVANAANATAFTASQFGIHASDFNTAASSTARQESARQSLRSRFGNRS